MILVVDDEPRNRFFLAAMLKRHGYEVAQAGSGSDALKICPQARPDVVITDLKMPELDGADLTRQIHANWPEISVILTSGYFTDKAQKVISAGWADFIYKPIEPDLLLTKIKRLLLRLSARKIQSVTNHQAAITPDGYRKPQAGETWHSSPDCTDWPKGEFENTRDLPFGAQLCKECLAKGQLDAGK